MLDFSSSVNQHVGWAVFTFQRLVVASREGACGIVPKVGRKKKDEDGRGGGWS